MGDHVARQQELLGDLPGHQQAVQHVQLCDPNPEDSDAPPSLVNPWSIKNLFE